MIKAIFLSLLLALPAIATNWVFHLETYYTGIVFVAGSSPVTNINTLIKLDFPPFNAKITNYPPYYPNTNNFGQSGRNYCRLNRLYPDGHKELVMDYNEGNTIILELMKQPEYPDICVMPNPENIFEAVFPLNIYPARGPVFFTMDRFDFTWETNCYLGQTESGQTVWIPCTKDEIPAEELFVISYPWIELAIPAGYHALEATENLTDWLFVEQINGPAV